VAQASVEEIDRLNILQASPACDAPRGGSAGLRPDEAWIDGNRCPGLACPERAIVSGDRLHAVISAASSSPRRARDAEMRRMHERYPHYGFDQHKGYPTSEHLAQLERHGRAKFTAAASRRCGAFFRICFERHHLARQPARAPLARVGPRCAHASQREAGFAGRRALIAALLDSEAPSKRLS
jgi:ribonuclease HII